MKANVVPQKMKYAFAIMIAAALCGCISSRHFVQTETELHDIMGGGGYPWVLVNVRMRDQPAHVICMSEPGFTCALIKEHNLQDKDFWQDMSNIISKGASSCFIFTKPEVWTNIPPPCDQKSLRSMRHALASISNDQLLKHDFESAPLELQGLQLSDSTDAKRVFAQVLIERGLRPFIGCADGILHIKKAKIGHNQPAQATGKPAPGR